MKAGDLKTLLGGFCLLLICATVSAKAAKAHGESKKARGCGGTGGSKDRIVGGRDAGIGEFPYQVSLRTNGQHFCGGSIISENWILSAAHCVYGNTMDRGGIVAVVGTNSLTSSDGTEYPVAYYQYHPSYDPSTIANDIAVLRLIDSIEMSDTVAPVPLSTSDPPAGSIATLSGWGLRAGASTSISGVLCVTMEYLGMIEDLTSYPGSASEALQMINLETITLQQCQELSPRKNIYSAHVCTLSPEGQGACEGDSGGPLVINGTQVGVVSWGIPCAQGYPDVFSSVAFYNSWIKYYVDG